MEKRQYGTIAGLPNHAREQVNEMLWNGAVYREVSEQMEARGFKFRKQVLTAWFHGTYQEWRKERERREHMKVRQEIIERALADGGGTRLAASKLYEALEDFDVKALKELLDKDPKEFGVSVGALTKLSKGLVDIDKFKAMVAEQKRQIEAELGVVKAGGGISPESFAKIEEALKLL
jgi:hypothetical protein